MGILTYFNIPCDHRGPPGKKNIKKRPPPRSQSCLLAHWKTRWMHPWSPSSHSVHPCWDLLRRNWLKCNMWIYVICCCSTLQYHNVSHSSPPKHHSHFLMNFLEIYWNLIYKKNQKENCVYKTKRNRLWSFQPLDLQVAFLAIIALAHQCKAHIDLLRQRTAPVVSLPDTSLAMALPGRLGCSARHGVV